MLLRTAFVAHDGTDVAVPTSDLHGDCLPLKPSMWIRLCVGVSQEGVVNVELNPFKPSPEQEEQMPLTKDQRVVLSLLQCGYSKYLYLPKERAISTHGWLG